MKQQQQSTTSTESNRISNPARLRPAIGGGMRSRRVIAALIAVAGISAALSAQSGQINGAGATFPNPITNPLGKDAYPIASFTWLLFYENPTNKAQAKVMVDFMKWALGDGQKFAKELGYAPLPLPIIAMELKALQKIKIQ